MTLRVRSDRRLIRATHRSERFVLVELTAPAAARRNERPPVNLGFVLDRSGSMSGEKIALARQAVEEAIARLHPEDRFSLVAYDDQVDVVLDSTTAGPEARRNAVDRLRAIDARGSTDLAGGWLRGAEQVALHLSDKGINRVLLLTDGLANVGITDPGEIERHATELRARGVSTSTFGVGADFDDRLLQAMADAGGGHFYFIANAAQIRDHITNEVGEVLEVVARDVAVEVTTPEPVEVGSLSPYRVEQRGSRTSVQVGDLVAEQDLQVVLRLRFPYGEVGREIGALVGVSDRDGALSANGSGLASAYEPQPLSWTYSDNASNDAQPRDRDVDRAVAALFAAKARQQAVTLNRAGDYAAAARALRSVAQRIQDYAGADPELRAMALHLHDEEDHWTAPAAEMTRKVAFAAASYSLRSRDVSGKATRQGR